MTVLDIMMKVAELGLLYANKDELAKIENYMQQTYGSMGYLFMITDHEIVIYELDNEKIGMYKNVTEEVLTAIYGEE